jgi:hypothetical protein
MVTVKVPGDSAADKSFDAIARSAANYWPIPLLVAGLKEGVDICLECKSRLVLALNAAFDVAEGMFDA